MLMGMWESPVNTTQTSEQGSGIQPKFRWTVIFCNNRRLVILQLGKMEWIVGIKRGSLDLFFSMSRNNQSINCHQPESTCLYETGGGWFWAQLREKLILLELKLVYFFG